MKKDKYWIYLWNNGKVLLIFSFIIMPIFVGIASLISQKWKWDFTITLIVCMSITVISSIIDYFKWRKL